ncbi:MAG TPA: glycosyl hydrolase 115 family protein [Verrucomicrobiae bacterium]|nr:glycosyl hydrolase 115 family protein [Verrucomicrobiae bacterium]
MHPIRLNALITSALLALSLSSQVSGQSWNGPVRGSWVREGAAQTGDVMLFDGERICDIEVPANENAAVKQAAVFLAGDLEKIIGHKPEIVEQAAPGHVTIHLSTAPEVRTADWPWSFSAGAWEAYDIRTSGKDVYCVGSNFRGTAFAVYTLSERLGMDPLYLWTGFQPEKRDRLTLKQTTFASGPPTFKYRGTFHDDEDILPRPYDNLGYPLIVGDVPTEWYARYFETILRLRMNMVAPYTRVHRRYEVQKLASDWGLFYTSHHYDILLSNPFGIRRFGLGEARHAGNDWDWATNRTGMLNYWRGGVEENKNLSCVWPVGLRGTDDIQYRFPKGTTDAERAKIYRDVINTQVQMVKEMAPANSSPAFHFTMYNEMLNQYVKDPAAFDMPEDVIVVWTDDNDGRMRFLPSDLGKWKHGVYYHLAYFGPVTKQNSHIVTPAMVAQEFKKITEAGATEYMLVNVSELREFIMETREIAEICWDANSALAVEPNQPIPTNVLAFVPSDKGAAAAVQPASGPAADKYVSWWCREYFGDQAAPEAAEVYHLYYELLNSYDKQWYGSRKVHDALGSLIKKFAGEEFVPARSDTLPALRERVAQYQKALALARSAANKMNRQQRQFFFDHAELPLLMDYRPTAAAQLLVEALAERDLDKAWQLCEKAIDPLEELEVELMRAEHPPFKDWYRNTWVRREVSDYNMHRPYAEVRTFLSSGGTDKLKNPDLK